MNNIDYPLIILFMSIFFCLFGILFFIFYIFNQRNNSIEKRVEDVHKKFTQQDYRNLSIKKRTNDWDRFSYLSAYPLYANLPLLFDQAGLYSDISKWLFLSVTGTAATSLAVYYLTSHILLATVTGPLLCIVLPYLYLLLIRRNRINEFDSQLAQALEIISRSLKAGHPFLSGMQMVVSEMPDPISNEFKIVLRESQLGIPLEDSLFSMTHRVPLIDLRMFALSIMIHKEVGGDLAEVLDNLAKVIRDRFRILGQVRALTAEGRLSGWILCALPPFLLFIISFINPNHVSTFTSTELGHKMIYTLIVLQVLGMLTIRKLVNIKV